MYCVGALRPRVTNAAVEMMVSSSGATATYWPSGRGIRIDGDAMREVADLALGQTDVIPRVRLEKIHARRAENVIPRRPHAKSGGYQQDDSQHHHVELAHDASDDKACRAESAGARFWPNAISSSGRSLRLGKSTIGLDPFAQSLMLPAKDLPVS